MRYVIEIDKPVDCLNCPLIVYQMDCFCHAHDECPLVPYDEMVMSEWVESVNSQPLKNEPKETVRVELYKSEIDKLGRLAMANGLSTAQMVAKLIEEYE